MQKKARFPAQVLPAPAAPPARVAVTGALARPAAAAVRSTAQPAPATPAAAWRQPQPAAALDASSQQGARERMVKRLEALPGMHPLVLEAMRQVPRHAFIDSALGGKAYDENSLPIGFGQTISKPSVVARMLSLLLATAVGSGRIAGRVLEVGTGCGYQAAVLSQIAAEVYSIERLRGLHERARHNLRPMRVANLHLLFGDGMAGYASGAPYAAIVSAAGGQAIPQAWVDQLAMGGRIIAPTVAQGGAQVLMVLDKTPAGLRQQALEAVHFVPLKSGVS
ncbi:protein-L-isoaspartate(D-aspartate) O-methyltransferase [Vandammella animalimorsus]|uniref:Protein-L-isoaspartate O-methyltransferase n=1 Tax=Vandammella animalimorsus TaxID=2029117 RepID=A0A3M6RTS2_9BURK|nr:protein-L-isoaspartate(D-aspartate) O-methyltransferase [Vandammella animalimorsus]RMX18923.1 protein-L-isoaspartate(D-aspartate) O-methyltransferase [Vandammella animalimorsus]